MFILAFDFYIMTFIRKLLIPFVPIYYVVTWMRNKCYDLGWKSSKSFDLPIICVGNLSTGGTGKTPTIEYLIRLLKADYKVATLSRGYKRETQGFILADDNASARTIGDEPYQFYRKFKDIVVGVDANRQHGISELIARQNPDLILLDDAFQHRKVSAGFNILLTSYANLYCDDIVLPTGNLREPRSGAQRANLIVVTKCPTSLLDKDKERIIKKLKPLAHQTVFFSVISYAREVRNSNSSLQLGALKGKTITVVTGIANPKPFVDYLDGSGLTFEHINFQDHHDFSNSEIEMLKKKSIILTTEKDYVRLKDKFKSNSSQLYYLPITFQIGQHEVFNKQVKSFVKTN
ncbi:lipid-A-disaccharide kinase [Formosa sp. Hel1_31_208]|nr:lipid-A-disaccharide kinase [Formosa sp. Hel1_31_208]